MLESKAGAATVLIAGPLCRLVERWADGAASLAFPVVLFWEMESSHGIKICPIDCAVDFSGRLEALVVEKKMFKQNKNQPTNQTKTKQQQEQKPRGGKKLWEIKKINLNILTNILIKI